MERGWRMHHSGGLTRRRFLETGGFAAASAGVGALQGCAAALCYLGERRCDLHPRASPDGRTVSIDSIHGGDGRQLYLLDVSGIVDG